MPAPHPDKLISSWFGLINQHTATSFLCGFQTAAAVLSGAQRTPWDIPSITPYTGRIGSVPFTFSLGVISGGIFPGGYFINSFCLQHVCHPALDPCVALSSLNPRSATVTVTNSFTQLLYREVARCFVSLNISLSHSRSFEMTPFDRWHTTGVPL